MADQLSDEPAAEQLLHVEVRREPAAIVVFADGDVDVLTVGRLRTVVDAALKDAAGRPVVVDATRAVIRPLQITGLDEVLALYYSVEEALPQ